MRCRANVVTDLQLPDEVAEILRGLPRAFYASLGFLPLEERTDIWGPESPCLIMVKPLV